MNELLTRLLNTRFRDRFGHIPEWADDLAEVLAWHSSRIVELEKTVAELTRVSAQPKAE